LQKPEERKAEVKIATKAYGLIEVDERQKIVFPRGLFGFEKHKHYLLLDAERQPFYWLQSTIEEQVAFVLVSPFLFSPDYELNIRNEELAEIGISSPDQALVFSIVTLPVDGSPITANLQGPLVISRESKVGRQLVLSDARWRTRHDIIAEIAASAGSA
jgi:flagellar assembly factor FliW